MHYPPLSEIELSETQFNQQIASYWSWVAKRGELGYWNVPGWEEHQNILASSDPQTSWIDVCAEHIAQQNSPKRHALSLGCGGGWYEKLWYDKGLFSSVDACDICGSLVEQAQERADKEKLPFHYFVQDLNHPSFPPQKYDVVIAAGILHHIKNLEQLFDNIRSTMKVGGQLIVYDYVGPSRFQWSAAQIARCNYWIHRLPQKYLKKRGYPWYYHLAKRGFDLLPFANSPTLKKILAERLPSRLFIQWLRLQRAELFLHEVLPPTPEQFLVTDPSEAIRSAEILPLINRYFSIEKLILQGGTLAQPLFGRTVANFIDDVEGQIYAKQILEDERMQLLNGSLPSDLVAFVASPNF